MLLNIFNKLYWLCITTLTFEPELRGKYCTKGAGKGVKLFFNYSTLYTKKEPPFYYWWLQQQTF